MNDDDIFDSFEQELIWLINQEGGVNKLAAALQISGPAISYWLHRKRKPSAQHALLLEAYTNGKIKRETIRPDIYPPTVLLKETSTLEGFTKKPFKNQN